jgi:hypothetical protein
VLDILQRNNDYKKRARRFSKTYELWAKKSRKPRRRLPAAALDDDEKRINEPSSD